MLQYIKDCLSIIESICVVLGVIFLVIQIRQQTRIARADHDRQKKQSTIDFYNLISSQSQAFFANAGENLLNLEFVKNNEPSKKSISMYLSRLERLAVGIACKVYDFNIINHMAGSYLIRKYSQLKEYIDNARKDHNPNGYREFEKLVKKLEKHRKNHLYKPMGSNIYVIRP